MLASIISRKRKWSEMLAFSNDYYGLIFRATQSVELFCAYDDYSSILQQPLKVRVVRMDYRILLKKHRLSDIYYIRKAAPTIAKPCKSRALSTVYAVWAITRLFIFLFPSDANSFEAIGLLLTCEYYRFLFIIFSNIDNKFLNCLFLENTSTKAII